MSATVRRRLVLTLSFLVSQVALAAIAWLPSAPGQGSWLQAFRGYFSYDQLSYAGIASTVAAGVPGLPEPFTETGQSYYPSLWYRVLGWLAAGLDASVPAVWTVAGLALLATSVAVLGWAALRISGRAWAPALVGPALLVGTLSLPVARSWYTTLDSHAVLWGPYGAIYALNAETAAFSLIGIAFALGLRASMGPPLSARRRAVLLAAAGVLLGVTANMQTYAFFVGTGIAFSALGAYGLLRSRSRSLLVASAVLLVLTVALGPRVAAAVGALPVYSLFLACTLPGIGWLAVRRWALLVAPAVLFVLAAVPQAALVASGILAEDPFLTYRQDVSSDLGVPLLSAVLASLPLASVWLFSVLVQRVQRSAVVAAVLAGMAFSATMLTFNDVWGFGQEPYRMWIDSVTLSALLLAPLTSWSIAHWRDHASARRRRTLRASAGVAVALLAVSLLDFGAFRYYVSQTGLIRFDSARLSAVTAITGPVDGLLTPGPCVDPQELKIASRQAVTFYNLGIAWPTDRSGIDVVLDSWRASTFSPEAMRAAGVRYLLTDSACPTVWPVDATMGFAMLDTLDYSDELGSGTLTLWRIA